MILIFIPTYNEAENAQNLYKEIKALGIEADILFMDDNSPDGTGKILDEMAKNDSGVKVLIGPGNWASAARMLRAFNMRMTMVIRNC